MRKGGIFAVAGRPVLHSASPAMHNAAFRALGMDAIYTRLAAESAGEALETARQIGMSGLSITAPFKEEMEGLLGGKDARVRKLGAANTVAFRKGRSFGFNSDVDGVRDALASAGVRMKGKRAVVLGAGGAAKAAVMALLEGGAQVTVANRTAEKARAIARTFGCSACGLRGKEFGDVMNRAAVVVSTISTSKRVVMPRLLRGGMAVLDAVYSQKTAISQDARAAGCKVIGGREWLLAQGKRAFGIFSGRKAPATAMRKAIAGKEGKRKRNVALIGFMGSGKTAVAEEIAKITGMKIVEMDSEIERKAGMSIRGIFERKGEAAFRRMERREVLSAVRGSGRVISCGGGAVLDERNVKSLKKSCVVVWLWATPEECARRIAGGRGRPLLNVKNRGDAARRIVEARLMLYASAADIVVSTMGRSAREVAGMVADETGKASARAAGQRGKLED